jgi:hypothetical protein
MYQYDSLIVLAKLFHAWQYTSCIGGRFATGHKGVSHTKIKSL